MFDEIRLAFFDYDRTMFTHGYPFPGWKHNSYYEDCITNLYPEKQTEAFQDDMPVPCTRWLAKHLHGMGVKTYVLTQEIFSLRDDWKKQHALSEFNIENYISVDTAEHKIDMIKAVANLENATWDRCLLVDDSLSTIYKACEAGIRGMHLSTLAAIYEHQLIGGDNAITKIPGCYL